MSLETPKRCPLCDSEFGCGFGAPGCWCEALDVPAARLLPVRAVTSACLCPRCLQAVAAGSAAASRRADADD